VSARVVFIPGGTPISFLTTELGRGTAGTWGVVQDESWLAAGAAGDPLELLYLSPADYQHAVRGLAPAEIEAAVDRRRTTFASQLPSLALGLVELQLRGSFALLGATPRQQQACGDLLVALASFTAVPRFSAVAPAALLQLVCEGDAQIVAELDSPSLQEAGDLDPTGEERATRRRFASEAGALLARRGADAGGALPYFDVERVYLITPVPEDLEAAAHSFHDPVERFGAGLLLPLAERNAGSLVADGHQLQVVFPTRGQFMGTASALTAAQRTVELNERFGAPAFVPYLAALRVQQATLRAAALLITGADAELAVLLGRHHAEEAARLGPWLASGAPAPAPGTTARGSLGSTLETATLLIGLCRQRGLLARTGGLEALARALSHVIDRLEG
jgi:hypothetical protein